MGGGPKMHAGTKPERVERTRAFAHAVTKRVELELARVSAREFITVNTARDLMLAAMHKARQHEAAYDVATVQAMLSDRPRS